MCFEVVLQIVVAIFAVFGLFSAMTFIGETWFEADNVTICFEVDTKEALAEIDGNIRRLRRKPLGRGNQITILVHRSFATEDLLRKLRRQHVRYYLIDMQKDVS